jgi:hypothetical protein
LASISNERTKFHNVTSELDQQYATDVDDNISFPRQKEPYTKLRTELVKRLAPTKEQGIRQLLTLEQASEFLGHLGRRAPEVYLT